MGTFSTPVSMHLVNSHSPGANSGVFFNFPLSIVNVLLTTFLSCDLDNVPTKYVKC